MLEDLISQIACTIAHRISIVLLWRLEHVATILAMLLLHVGRSSTAVARHLTNNASRLLEHAFVIDDVTRLTVRPLAVQLFVVEGAAATNESRVQQIVILGHLGCSFFVE